MSRDYFVNRQDRYVLFKDCPSLADFFSNVVEATLSHSFTLAGDGSNTRPSALPFDPLSSRTTARAFKTSLGKAIKQLTQQSGSEVAAEGGETGPSSELDTVVFPLMQMGFCGIKQDEAATSQLLCSLGEEDLLRLASGYFNLPPLYAQAILRGRARYDILAAAPQVCIGRYLYFDSPDREDAIVQWNLSICTLHIMRS